jgi:hypothetical protein
LTTEISNSPKANSPFDSLARKHLETSYGVQV